MTNDLMLNNLLDEMKAKGSLPALNDTVLEISRIAKKPESSLIELATVIMRDCGMASNLLATVNSAYYAPRFPITAISSAVTYLGFEKVFLLAFGLSLFRQIMSSMRKHKLLKLYAASYFAGILSMSLAKAYRHPNPEEAFMAGLFCQLPCVCLANAFAHHFNEMENRMKQEGVSLNQACREVFQVQYRDICRSLLEFYNLPNTVTSILCDPYKKDAPLGLLVNESVGLAAMLFGDQPGGRHVLSNVQRKIGGILQWPDFSVANLIRNTLKTDGNVKYFFNLAPDDVEMLVNILEWGKANPIEVVTRMRADSATNHSDPADKPEYLIGHFLTELELGQRRGDELNQTLMLAQEALFRCLPHSEIFIAFVNADKTALKGRLYLGSIKHLNAQDFSVQVGNSDSAIIQCISMLKPCHWQAGGKGLGLPYQPFGKIPFHHAYLAPIALRNQPIGICFVGRLNGREINERECVWVDKIVESLANAFASSRL